MALTRKAQTSIIAVCILAGGVVAVSLACNQPRLDEASDGIIGVWSQEFHDNGKWLPGGEYEVTRTADGYTMTTVDDSMAPKDAIRSQGLSDVKFGGESWSFSSDWGEHGVSQFKLSRQSAGVFIGYSYLNEEMINKNRWTRISR